MDDEAKDIDEHKVLVAFKPAKGINEYQVILDKGDDTIWATELQIGDTFDRDRTVIGRHIRNPFKEGELDKDSVSAKFAHTAEDGKTYQVNHYNLDVIISVGYRVKSSLATEFRKWATSRLKEYLLQGYTVNQKLLRSRTEKVRELEQKLNFLNEAAFQNQKQITEESLFIIDHYSKSFELLNRYDSEELSIEGLTEQTIYKINYKNVKKAIHELKKSLIEKGKASDIFGNERDKSFEKILGSISRTVFGQLAYPTIMKYPIFILLLFIGTHPLLQAQPTHDYRVARYDSLHTSPRQQWFRTLAPVPTGVVYLQHPGDGEAEMRAHFRTMKELGYNALKQVFAVPGWTDEQIQQIALEEGVIPWWYGQGGWEPITDSLLTALSISTATPIAEVRKHPAMVDYQTDVLRRRIKRAADFRRQYSSQAFPRGSSVAYDASVGGRGIDLSERGDSLFVAWARKQYGTISRLNKVYNQDHANLRPKDGALFQSWSDFAQRWSQYNHREYRIRRDILRFKADHGINNIRQQVATFQEIFPHAPYRGGGELGLFLPQSWYGVDLEGIADLMTDAGSFYPSMHFSWHFGQVDNELVRPSYMQASFMTDLFKGGWSAAWESTGGPQQFDGEKTADDKGFYVDDGTLMQFYLSQLAAGFKGFGIWCWNARSAGKEAGEYSLLDRNNQVTPRARQLGQFARALENHRDELWQMRKEPLVGVLYSWDSEGIWAAMSVQGRDAFRMRPIEARVGVSRALINANVPYEYVTVDDLMQGLAPRYPVLYLPAVLALDTALLPVLHQYVEQGGRLVMDMPSAWYDTQAALLPTDTGSAIEQLFGITLDDFQYAGINRSFSVDSLAVEGSFVHMTPTRARTLASFSHGKPAVTEHALGQGSAVIIGFATSSQCFTPGHSLAEQKLLEYTLGGRASPYTCSGAIAYRLAAPTADYYILINDGPATTASLRTDFTYSQATDAMTGKQVSLGQPIPLDAHSGRWLRMQK